MERQARLPCRYRIIYGDVRDWVDGHSFIQDCQNNLLTGCKASEEHFDFI